MEVRHVREPRIKVGGFIGRLLALVLGVGVAALWFSVPSSLWFLVLVLLGPVLVLALAAWGLSRAMQTVWILERAVHLNGELGEAKARAEVDLSASIWRIKGVVTAQQPIRPAPALGHFLTDETTDQQYLCLKDEFIKNSTPEERQFVMVSRLIRQRDALRRSLLSGLFLLGLGFAAAVLSTVSLWLVLVLIVACLAGSFFIGKTEAQYAVRCRDPLAALQVIRRQTGVMADAPPGRLLLRRTEAQIRRHLAKNGRSLS